MVPPGAKGRGQGRSAFGSVRIAGAGYNRWHKDTPCGTVDAAHCLGRRTLLARDGGRCGPDFEGVGLRRAGSKPARALRRT